MKKIIHICIFVFIMFLFSNNLDLNTNFKHIDDTKKCELKSVETLKDFSIYKFTDIKLGDSEETLIKNIGQPNRKDFSEYGFNWYVYNNIKGNFAMVGVKNKKVVALYSNSLNSSDINEIKLGDTIKFTRQNHRPIKYKKKGNTKFMIDSKNQFDIFKEDNKYITVFYDLHNECKVTSYQVIDKKIEDNTKDIYPKFNKKLKVSFERETIDLINSVRDRYNLCRLNYNQKASISALKHSLDMRDNNFFEHENLKGESPFERMKKENIMYKLAGENIAAGQINAIYAHEALMNSMGHRKNILGDYDKVGVGVSFGGYYKLYYTQNFFK